MRLALLLAFACSAPQRGGRFDAAAPAAPSHQRATRCRVTAELPPGD